MQEWNLKLFNCQLGFIGYKMIRFENDGFKCGEIAIIKIKVSNSTGLEVKWWNLTTLK